MPVEPRETQLHETQLHKTLCNRDCPDACSIVASVRDGRVVKLAGDPEHPITRGFLCYHTNQLLQRQYSPERLTTPLMRKAGELTPVGWDEALDHIARELQRIRRESGPAAIFHYRGGGSPGLLKVLSDYFFEVFGPVTVHPEAAGGLADGRGPGSALASAASRSLSGTTRGSGATSRCCPRAAISTSRRAPTA